MLSVAVHFENLQDKRAFALLMGQQANDLTTDLWYRKPKSTDSADTWQLYYEEIRKLMRERGHYADCGPICGRCCRPVDTRKEMFTGGHATGKCNAWPKWFRDHYAGKRKEKALKEAAEKFEALASGGDVLVIPEIPGEIIPTGFAEAVRGWVQRREDIATVKEAQRRLLGWETYLINRRAEQVEVQKACRYAEIRIGELLGPPPGAGPGRGNKTLNAINLLLSPQERVVFRRLEVNKQIAYQCLADGRTSRSAILSEIKASKNGGVEIVVPLEVEPLTSTPVASTLAAVNAANGNGLTHEQWTLQSAIARIEKAIEKETAQASGGDYRALGEWLAERGEQMKITIAAIERRIAEATTEQDIDSLRAVINHYPKGRKMSAEERAQFSNVCTLFDDKRRELYNAPELTQGGPSLFADYSMPNGTLVAESNIDF